MFIIKQKSCGSVKKVPEDVEEFTFSVVWFKVEDGVKDKSNKERRYPSIE